MELFVAAVAIAAALLPWILVGMFAMESRKH